MVRAKQIQSVKGMRDILPEEQPSWDYVVKKAVDLLADYSFEKIEVPVLEQTEVFLRGVGKGTDIVEKELYTLRTRGGDHLAVRPEFTAPVARAYIENGFSTRSHPVKLYYVGPVLRHDKPQAFRYRQLNQIGIELFGDETAAADAEVIFILHRLFENLGIKNHVVHINTIGDATSRTQYIRALKDYYRPKLKKVCAQCRDRYKRNPLRLLDCKEEVCAEFIKDAPQILDYLDDSSRKHFKDVLEFLDETGVPYNLNPYLVRGLDYYTRTVFEFWPAEDSEIQVSLAGGGRYDKLVESLGGPKTPAVGWSIGMERLMAVIKESNVKVPELKKKYKVFFAQLGERAKKKSLLLFEQLRKAGVPVKASFGRDSIKSQLRIANRLGVKYTLIFGQKEALDETIIIREMDSGVQETVLLKNVVEEVKKRLQRK
jgi:histidyl-tRNA synthetase